MCGIYCKPTAKGVHSFYVRHTDGNDYYLFSQPYRQGVSSYFRNCVSLDNALDKGKARHDTAVLRTMEKLPMYLRYVEKEQGIKIFRKENKGNGKRFSNRI